MRSLRSPSDSRLIEILHALVKEHSTPASRPDMTDEHLLLKLMQLVVDETRAVNQVEYPE